MLLNRLRALDWIERCELDVIVASSPVNVQYLTDFQLWVTSHFRRYMAEPGGGDERLALFGVLTSRGSAALVVHHGIELNAADIWVKDRYVYGVETEEDASVDTWSPVDVADSGETFQYSWNRYDTATDALSNLLRDRSLGMARIGLEMRGLSAEDMAAIRSALPNAEIRDCSNLLRLIRMVKSEEEQDRLRTAAMIAERAAMNALKLAQPHRSFCEMTQCFRESVARDGADLEHFAFSAQGFGIATEPDYRLAKHEVAMIDFGCLFKSYVSDAGLTLVLGDPDERTREIVAIQHECLSTTADRLRPGTPSSEIQAHMEATFAERGISNQFPHGHGLGLDVRDYPILVPDNGRRIKDECIDMPSNLPLEEGMLLNLEAPIYGIGNRAFQLEQTYRVTAAGGEPITDRDLSRAVVV